MGQPPARSKITRKQTKAYAEAKDDKAKDEAKVEEAVKAEDKAEAAEKSETSNVLPPEANVEIPAEAVAEAMTKGSTAEAMGMAPPSKELIEAAATPPSTVENPASLPAPKDVPTGDPGDPAPAPGRVPPGDSRSLRYGNLFALIYRHGTFLITRSGTVGRRGVWKVVEYPTTASASNGYAKEASRFVSEGFTDYRE